MAELSIATVSLSGSLDEKLRAIAGAGFDAVEIFENDLLTFNGSPRDVGRLCRDLGLSICAFQPFRDFEGMPEPQRGRNFARAQHKFDLMQELGTDLLLICSNVSPASLGGIDRAAADFRALGELAAPRGLRVGFEALAWGRHVNDYRDAWEIVRRADHKSIGIILDSFHALAPGFPVTAMASIPADKIFLVQLADAPKLGLDVLSWSRHFRCFPGQGDLPVGAFMEAIAATGYAGPLSLEIFNDQFRSGSAVRTATDGLRSLILLEDQLAQSPAGTPAARLQPRAQSRGVGFVEFAVDEAKAKELSGLFGQLGFRKTGSHRSKDVERWSQGNIELVINCEPDGFAHSHYITHGPGVCAIAIDVDDAGKTMARAEALKAHTFYSPVGPGELEIPAIRGVGGSLLYFLETAGKNWDTDFEALRSDAATDRLIAVDHISQSMPYDEMLSWLLFYTGILDLQRLPQMEIADPVGSRAVPGADQRQSGPARDPQRLVGHANAVVALHQRILRLRGPAHCVLLHRYFRSRCGYAGAGCGLPEDSGQLLRRYRSQIRSRCGDHGSTSRQPDSVRPRRRRRILPDLYPHIRRAVLLRDRAAPQLSGFWRRQCRRSPRCADAGIPAVDHPARLSGTGDRAAVRMSAACRR